LAPTTPGPCLPPIIIPPPPQSTSMQTRGSFSSRCEMLTSPLQDCSERSSREKKGVHSLIWILHGDIRFARVREVFSLTPLLLLYWNCLLTMGRPSFTHFSPLPPHFGLPRFVSSLRPEPVFVMLPAAKPPPHMLFSSACYGGLARNRLPFQGRVRSVVRYSMVPFRGVPQAPGYSAFILYRHRRFRPAPHFLSAFPSFKDEDGSWGPP